MDKISPLDRHSHSIEYHQPQRAIMKNEQAIKNSRPNKNSDSDDMVLLYIDNCRQSWDAILKFVQRTDYQLKTTEGKVKRLIKFIYHELPEIMKPDQDSKMYLQQELKDIPRNNYLYWTIVWNYYRQKVSEQE